MKPEVVVSYTIGLFDEGQFHKYYPCGRTCAGPCHSGCTAATVMRRCAGPAALSEGCCLAAGGGAIGAAAKPEAAGPAVASEDTAGETAGQAKVSTVRSLLIPGPMLSLLFPGCCPCAGAVSCTATSAQNMVGAAQGDAGVAPAGPACKGMTDAGDDSQAPAARPCMQPSDEAPSGAGAGAEQVRQAQQRWPLCSL